MIHKVIFGLNLIGLLTGAAVAQTCPSSKEPKPLGTQIAKAALIEYSEFNGHRINEDGYLWKFGSVESETGLLHVPDDEVVDVNRSGRFAWRRVWDYWLALDKHVPGEAMSRKVISVPGLLENPATSEQKTELRLRDIFSRLGTDDENTTTAVRQAAVRAALNDSPWSAAFISYLMDQVGLSNQQFQYSSAHWQYVKKAFEKPEGYVYRACDPRRTTPSVGDLLCYSRGTLPLKNYTAWRNEVQQPGFSTPAHCEVVTNVDLHAKKIEVVGGNVFHSVTRRKLKLNAQNVLSDSHNPDRSNRNKNKDCESDPTCLRQNLNLQYWGVLLQLN